LILKERPGRGTKLGNILAGISAVCLEDAQSEIFFLGGSPVSLLGAFMF
jgi:hypothetical protein